MLCPGRSSLEIMAGEQQPLLMEATLDGLLSELGSLYASLSGEVARAEIANQDLHANNQQLRSISSRAEDVAAGGDKDGNAQQPNANKLKGGKGKEASTVAEVPSRDSLGKVLAQARAARESGTPKGTQSGHTQSGERKFRAQGQVRNDATIPASRPHKETLSQIARGATRMAAASREAVYKAATPSLSARQQPTSESTSLEEPKVRVTPSAPCLPKRLKVAVQRVKLVRQKRLGMDANNEEAGAHAGARGNRGFYTDQVRTAGRDFVERLSASRVKSTHHQTTARGLRDVWLAHTSQRYCGLEALPFTPNHGLQSSNAHSVTEPPPIPNGY